MHRSNGYFKMSVILCNFLDTSAAISFILKGNSYQAYWNVKSNLHEKETNYLTTFAFFFFFPLLFWTEITVEG